MSIAITNPNNPRIKEVVKLGKAGERQRRGVTVVEGLREVQAALARGVVPVEAFVCRELLSPAARPLLTRLALFDQARRTWLAEVTPEVFAKLALREDSGGVLLVIPFLAHRLDALDPPHPAFIAVVEGVEKPGNLGAILRTADAAGVHGVIVAAGATDLHNPNVIRASLGTFFSVPLAEASPGEAIAWLRAHDIAIVAATPATDRHYTDVDLTRPVAIVLGSEAAGLTDAWGTAADSLVTIPMFGQADSLNLAASTAILLYEVVRQRLAAQPVASHAH
jgi:TrmH family RNA methyltransferase